MRSFFFTKKAELGFNKIIGFTLLILVIFMVIPSILDAKEITLNAIHTVKLKDYEYGCYQLRREEDCSKVVKDCGSKEKIEENSCSPDDIKKFEEFAKLKICDEYEKVNCDEDEIKEWDDYVAKYSDENTNINVGNVNIKEVLENYPNTPYGLTAQGETGGRSDPLETAYKVVPEADGSYSYGNCGLNSNGGAITFWKDYGKCLGLKGTPGTEEATESWKEVAEKNPEALVLAEISWYNKYIIEPNIKLMKERNFPEEFVNNPAILAYLCDVSIQMRETQKISLLNNVQPKSGETPEEYLNRLAEYQSSDKYLETAFATYLKKYPKRLEALKNRVLKTRLPLSQEVTITKLEVTEQCIVA